MRYGFVIDQTTCIGCHACTVACKTEHNVPLGVNRTWVKYVESGTWPDTRRFFSVMRCNHCADAPCVTICPTRALYKRHDGIVDFDTSRCIGCKSCMQACPYDALYIHPGDHTAQKCNYCAHRTDIGLEPACVVVCPEQAIVAGDLDNPATRIAQLVATEELSQRSVEQGTRPNLWYRGASVASLDPLGAVDSGDGGIWQDPAGSWLAVELTPGAIAAAGPKIVHEPATPARVVYNSRHPMPWGWRVSSYFLTKGIAAGLAIVMALALLAGADVTTGWARLGVPIVAGALLAATGGLLVWDLKRPDRFLYLLTKGNPGSWLVRGAWILSAYAALLAVWTFAGIFTQGPEVDAMMFDGGAVLPGIVWIAAGLGLAVAGYTALLFGQAEARDLWQNPLLLWHMIAGAFSAGGGATLLFAFAFGIVDPPLLDAASWCLIGGAAALGLIAAAELMSRHPTRNAAEAMHHLSRGEHKTEWWVGGQLIGVAVPVVLGFIYLGNPDLGVVGAGAGIAAMAGIWFADDAYVKAGQSVPLS